MRRVGSPTIDQIIARKIGQETLLPSLQLACEDPNSSSSNCGEGLQLLVHELDFVDRFADAAERAVSCTRARCRWSLNPQNVFERLFGSGATPEMRAARMRQNRSILDSIRGQLASLHTAARSVRIGARPSASTRTRSARSSGAFRSRRTASADVPEILLPTGIPESFDEHIKLHFDMTALAFRADITRVATLLGARDLTARSYVYPKGDLVPERRRQRQLPRRLATIRKIPCRSAVTRTSTGITSRRSPTSPRS